MTAERRDSSDRLSGGLTSADASCRRREHGPNEISREEGPSGWLVLARQFNSPVIYLLVAACVLSAGLGEAADAIAILTIVVLNGLIGFAQERRAERAILALHSMTAPRARVRRDGMLRVIPAADVVVGDVLVLEAGDLVPADARLVAAANLTTNEASLTGESVPAGKSAEAAPADAPLAERTDSVFMGTAVAAGTAVAEVVAIGMATELGRIAHLLATAESGETPLQTRLAGVTRLLVKICLGIVGAVAVAGALRGWAALDVFLASVSLAVAAVPEGLPAVVTIALAVGVQRMAARHVLIRRLAAVETLGCATVVCTDKTGTLTTGVMTVRELWGGDERRLLFAAAACTDAEWRPGGGVGDPTELAILAAAADRGIERREIESARPRVSVAPFDAVRKRMAIRRADGVLYVKGAVEEVVPRSARGTDGALDANAAMAARGLRVLAVAIGHDADERNLELVGLIGISDPPRPEAIAAVAAAHAAGITVVMITGDHPVTARAIAGELGLADREGGVDELVHARATPEDKLRIVRAWKARGEIVAMTGDGVNDAPALREAHIGIAMGRTGTEVTREASDMVLADDNFASIIAAVKEGRGVYDNIRKTLVYLLAGNTSELIVMLAAALAGLPLPLLPIQLLWINIVTDGLPALALVMDPVDDEALARPPRAPSEPMLGRAQWRAVLWTGLLEGSAVLAVFAWALRTSTVADARSVAFTTIVFAELFRAFAARSATRIFWAVGALTNVRLLLVIALSAAAQIGLYLVPPAREIFGIVPLPAWHWGLCVVVGLLPVSVIELRKLLTHPSGPARPPTPRAG